MKKSSLTRTCWPVLDAGDVVDAVPIHLDGTAIDVVLAGWFDIDELDLLSVVEAGSVRPEGGGPWKPRVRLGAGDGGAGRRRAPPPSDGMPVPGG